MPNWKFPIESRGLKKLYYGLPLQTHCISKLKVSDMIIPVPTKEIKPVKFYIKLTFKGILLAFLAFLISSSLIVLKVSKGLYDKLMVFSTTSGMSLAEIKQTAITAYNQTKQPLKDKKTILILGIDKLETRPGAPVLTDTILLATIDFSKATITTLPLPRDLWSDKYKSRINALYYYALERGESNPAEFLASAISDLTTIPIDQSVVVEMNELSALIDLVDGVEINVTEAFIDEMFPRPDVDVTKVTDPKLLYKTVEFKEGIQTMDGERSLEYVRSRKSNGIQGTDLARSQRQQQVIMAIFSKVKNMEKLLDPEYAGMLVKFYKKNFERYIPIEEATLFVVSVGQNVNNLSFKNTHFTIYPEQQDGVLFHPSPKLYNNQWLYVIRDEQKFKEYVLSQLGLRENEATIRSTN